MKTYTVILEQDEHTDDLILPIPQEILDEMHWHEGTVLEMTVNSDNTISIKKANT